MKKLYSKCIVPILLAVLSFVLIIPSVFGQDSVEVKTDKLRVQYGTASFYHDKFVGRKTATGELFRQDRLTAAHNTLPLGTYIRVTNMRNRKSVVVRINDRLHYRNPRLVDLSKAAAHKLGYVNSGLTRVKVEVLGKKPVSD
ncbi:MAG: septal ring lytic transglycosylase RlpA family protein [Lacibacter sp.]